ncbi:hypothetical protein GDO86_013272 [Hymenochirus boettgeri]|uniref:J domain-containing protein n=1 Tax=Hymenochirus boettgeri TaxID=247094 RepID=A0A8T2IYQ2_9PIPI|nr:hypothetical protein GDO86_013272 [Hymenochirus boettgeri]
MDPDYYSLLGCDELSTVEQILAEYKVRALECHPDKHPGNQKAVEDFQKLQQAKETLANEESRSQYSMHWAVQNKKEPMLEAPVSVPSNMSEATSCMCKERKQETDTKPKTSEDNLQSPKSPEGSCDPPFSLLRFRCSAEAPSDLLRKFRNYEI